MRFIKSMFLILMLTPALIYSQNTYPKKILINSDTSCLISIAQVKAINGVFVDRDEYRDINDSLNSQISTYEESIANYKNIVRSQDVEISLNDNMRTEYLAIFENNKIEIKKLKKQKKFLIAFSVLMCGIAILF